ncbi:MAG: hypothetical protein E7183_05175 [Erysipelotrichaceae bacterium]|nr:hypothetical protein [Erysipelotrichaceae bacterium]
MMKKIFFSFMTLIILLFISFFGLNTFTVSAYVDNDLDSEYTNVETILNDTYEQVYNSFIISNKIYNNKQYNVYDENFSGVFVDSDGVLNIAYVNNDTLTYTGKINNNSLIKFVEFTFSYNYLQQVLNCIEDIMIEYNVTMVQISDENNQVLVFTKDNNKISNIIQYLESKGLYEQGAISFICDPLVNFSKTLETSYGGESIFYMEPIPERPGYVNVSRGTIGVQAVNNVTGELGILTNEHVAPMGKDMYYGEHFDSNLPSRFTKQIFLGTPSITHSGNTTDASFVPFADQSDWEISPYSKYNSTIFNNIFLGTNSQIINGRSITKIGQTTGITNGIINNSNTSVNVDGTIFSNVIIYTNSSQSGDSGGPVYYNDGTNLFLIGLNFAGGTISNTPVGVACRISNVMSDLNVTPITNDSFSTTVLPDGTIQLDAINFNFNGAFVVPSSLNGRIVSKIGSNVFKNRNQITKIILPDTINSIGDSAFENCSSLQSVTWSPNLVTIGASAFKGCTNLDEVIIPNTVTNIDSYAFEGCTNLESVTLSNSLYAIGIGAFKGCTNLEEIEIPASVQHVDSSAFENCTNLTSVIVKRAVTGITNLGSNVFDGCSTSLQIVVPQDRVAEYKNKVYWSSYRSKIIPDNSSYSEIELYCLIDEDDSVTLNAGYNKLYKLVVECTRSYKFVTDASSKIIVYNSDMTVAYSGNNSLPAYLNKGSYYLSIEHSTVTTSGTIKINYEPAYNPDGIAIAYNSSNGTNIASGLHLTDNNIYHARLKYTNYNGAGFYKFTLNAGASAIYPVNAIQVYTDANRTNLLSMYSLSELDIFAQSNENENIMYIYLPENGTYYIDVTLPLSSYSTLTFNIQSIEVNNINYLNSLTSIDFDVLFENVNTQSCFEEVTISHRSEIQLDIISSGTIYNDIKVYVFEKVRDPGYEPGINYYYIESVYIDEITSTNRSPVFTLILDPGTYYFGYAENEDAVNINFALRRMVDYNMNMQGILVADPYYTGYDLGTEVLFNSGECDEYTITEGFTRNIYLMVEDRLRDPMSRLDYDWYSSNENVAIVTNYGTVLAMSVTEDTTVTIYAVLKDDPKVVYYRTFTVLNDEEEDLIEIELNMSYSYVAENGTYQLELTNTNCPYPMIQYYSWNILNESEETVTMNYWGQISSTGICTVLIVGTYNLNSRVRLYITLIIE